MPEDDERECDECSSFRKICDHRFRSIYQFSGPTRLTVKLVRCTNTSCPQSHRTRPPAAELSLAAPGWVLSWDVVAWLGFRRFARHWSVPTIRNELADSYDIRLSEDAIEDYAARYQALVAARHTDLALMKEAYKGMDSLIFSVDGLQPEKGHETLYVIRELRLLRTLFAVPLLSSTNAEVQRQVIEPMRDLAHQLGLPVVGVVSDKQDALVQGFANVFPGVDHRYCHNHFLRDVAKPVLEEDSHIKVETRTHVRGLRTIEKEVLEGRGSREVKEGQEEVTGQEPPSTEPGPKLAPETHNTEPPNDVREEVVLDYCATVRGILNSSQGGPLEPPGLRMAAELEEVKQSIASCLDAKKGGLLTYS